MPSIFQRLKTWLTPKSRRAPEPEYLIEPVNEVLCIPESTSAEELALYMKGETPMPPGAHWMSFADFTAIGRVSNCDCNLIQCTCLAARQHKLECRYRFAMTCAIPISCTPHGLYVCTTCDPCSCNLEGEPPGAQDTPDQAPAAST